MKTAVMKLSALVVLACAGVTLANTVRVPAAVKLVETLRTEVLRAIDGRVGMEWFTVVLCLLVMAIALWALLPRMILPRRVVRVESAEGPVWVELYPVRRTLNRVAKRLSSVRRAKVRVRPVEHGRAALVSADLVLRVGPREAAPAVGDRVAAQLRRAAEDLLGAGAHVRMETRIVGVVGQPGVAAARLDHDIPQAPAAPAAAAHAVDPRLEAMADAPVGTDPAARAALEQSMALLDRLDAAPAVADNGAARDAAALSGTADGDEAAPRDARPQ